MSDQTLDLASLQVREAHDKPLRLQVQTFFDEATFTASHVAYDPTTRHAAIIDSVLDFDPASARTSTRSAGAIVDFIESERLAVDYHLETHTHVDHLSAEPFQQQKLDGKLAIGREIFAVQNVFGEIFNFGPDFARDGRPPEPGPDGRRYLKYPVDTL